MSASEAIMWGIHAGRTGDAHTLFMKKNFVAIGWPQMGDLSKLPADREVFKAKVSECFPTAKPGAIPNNAGQLFRFVHEMKEGDYVVYPSKHDRQIHIGKITGPYKYDPGLEASYPNVRKVNWLRSLPRSNFKQGALYEIGSAMSLFQVKNYSDEFLTAVEGKVAPQSVATDETVAAVAKDIEQTTRDFIIKRLSLELKGHPMALFVAHLLETMGYKTRVSPEGPDGGIDIIAHTDELGFEPPIIKVQVKSGEGSIGGPEVTSLYGNVAPEEFGLFVTIGTFTPAAKTFARNHSNLRLIDGNELVDLVLQHYQEFDVRYSGLLPLKRVYVPEVLEEGEE